MTQRKNLSNITTISFYVKIEDDRALFEQITKPLSKEAIIRKLQNSDYGILPYFVKSKIKIKDLKSSLSPNLVENYKNTSEYLGDLIILAVNNMIKKDYPIMGNYTLEKLLKQWKHESFPKKIRGKNAR